MKPIPPAARSAEPTPPAGRGVLGWRVLLVSCLALIALLAWMPGHQVPLGTSFDKLNHVLAFAALGFVAWRAYPRHRLLAFSALIGFGLLIELVQWQLPTRSAELVDVVADVIGLALGSLLGRWVPRLPRWA